MAGAIGGLLELEGSVPLRLGRSLARCTMGRQDDRCARDTRETRKSGFSTGTQGFDTRRILARRGERDMGVSITHRHTFKRGKAQDIGCAGFILNQAQGLENPALVFLVGGFFKIGHGCPLATGRFWRRGRALSLSFNMAGSGSRNHLRV
ncbi:hypothetical protein ASAP_2715 [Asaia bogorensis]|uniref:Uncharacterized protein n=1 Tax=Asaia bogorensis TaxID=91915 RepID=A0A060QIL5_9PROT|nr:hypothetical protein ASAP_2715 [Asaia bogorensis]